MCVWGEGEDAERLASAQLRNSARLRPSMPSLLTHQGKIEVCVWVTKECCAGVGGGGVYHFQCPVIT